MDRLSTTECLTLELHAAHAERVKEDERHRFDIRTSVESFRRNGGEARWIEFVRIHQEMRTA